MHLLNSFKDLPCPDKITVEIQNIVDHIYALDSSEAIITFCGRFKSGKSSLINAILGCDLLPTRAITATAVITKIFYADVPKAYVVEKAIGDREKVYSIGMSEVASYILLKEKSLSGVRKPSIKEVCIGVPHPLLRSGIVIVDTPGLEDDDELTKITMQQLEYTDLAIMIYDASQFMTGNEKKILVRMNEGLSGNIVFVVNRMDMIEVSEGDGIKEAAAYYFKGFGNKIVGEKKLFFTSAHKNNPGIKEFVTWLEKLIDKDKNQLVRISRISAIKALLQQLQIKISEELENCTEDLRIIQDLSKKAIEEKKKANKQLMREKMNTLHVYRASLFQELNGAFLTRFSKSLEDLKKNSCWEDNFKTSAKDAAKAHIDNYFKSVKKTTQKKLGEVPFNIPEITCGNMLNSIDFPSATANSSGNGLAIAGAGVGMLFGPIGGLIGSKVGKLISDVQADKRAANECVDKAIDIMKLHINPQIIQKLENYFISIEKLLRAQEENITIDGNYQREIEDIKKQIDQYKEIMEKCKDIIAEISIN